MSKKIALAFITVAVLAACQPRQPEVVTTPAAASVEPVYQVASTAPTDLGQPWRGRTDCPRSIPASTPRLGVIDRTHETGA